MVLGEGQVWESVGIAVREGTWSQRSSGGRSHGCICLLS
jgi:hypothetical protein